MSEIVFETFDQLFKALHKYGRRIEDLEAKVCELERRLHESAAPPVTERPGLRVVEREEVER